MDYQLNFMNKFFEWMFNNLRENGLNVIYKHFNSILKQNVSERHKIAVNLHIWESGNLEQF